MENFSTVDLMIDGLTLFGSLGFFFLAIQAIRILRDR